MTSIHTYGQVNAKVRTLRSFLLTDSIYRSLAAAQNQSEILSILSQTKFHHFVNRIDQNDPFHIENELVIEEISRIKTIEKECQGIVKEVISLYLERYDFEKLKILLRIWHRKSEITPPIIHQKIVYNFPSQAIIEAADLNDIANLLINTPFYKIIVDSVDYYNEKKTLFYIEIALDKDFYQRFWGLTQNLKKKDREISNRLLGIEIDLKNLLWMGRLRSYYNLTTADIKDILLSNGYHFTESTLISLYSEGKFGDLFADIFKSDTLKKLEVTDQTRLQTTEQDDLIKIELMLDMLLLNEARKAFGAFPFTIGAILGYFILLRIETKNILTLLKSKDYEVSSSQVESFLTF